MKLHLVVLFLISGFVAACTATPIAEPVASSDVSETPTPISAVSSDASTSRPESTPVPQPTPTTRELGDPTIADFCEAGAIPLVTGTTGMSFSADGVVSPSVNTGVCKHADGTLSLLVLGRSSGEQLRLNACQKSPDVWEAATGPVTYRLVDERNSQRAVAGVLSIRDSDSTTDRLTWHIESNIERTVAHQNSFDAPLCEGSQRLCTSVVDTNETLNLRIEPALDAAVVTGIPGGSCAVWAVDNGDAAPAGWIPVVFAPGDSPRLSGFVSDEFVTAAPLSQVVDVHGVATIAFGTPWPEAISKLTAQLGEPDEANTFDICGNPGEIEHNATWDNLVVVAHAPVDQPGTNPPVLTFAAVGAGEYTATAGLQGESTWHDFVTVFPGAVAVDSVFALEARSHLFDDTSWANEFYLAAGFLQARVAADVDESSVLGSVSAGHTWAAC